MATMLNIPLAATASFPWLNLVWVLLGITVLLFAVAGAGRWLAATHPEPVARVRTGSGSPAVADTPAPEIEAAIAAAVYASLGASASITSVTLHPNQPQSVENLMLTWSLEGRRQIYTSHKVR